MRTLAVLPVKSFDAAKQRLSDTLRGGSRQLLAQAMFADVLGALRRVDRIDGIAVVTSDHEAEALLRGERITVLADPHGDGQSAAAQIGIDHAIANDYRRVLLVPSDTPLADPAAIDSLLERSRGERTAVTIVPDRHRTGTNALVLCPPEAIRPSFGIGSFARHLELVREAGVSHRVEDADSLMHDVDTPEDLAALSQVLERRHGVAPRTRGALRQLDRLRRPADGRPARPEEKQRRADGVQGSVRVMSGRGRPEEPSADQRPAWA